MVVSENVMKFENEGTKTIDKVGFTGKKCTVSGNEGLHLQ